MIQQDIRYQAGGTECIARVCTDSKPTGKRPAVLIVHAFEGRVDTYDQQAEALAKLGYVGIAVDMYGDAQTADTLDGCMALLMPLLENRQLCRDRLVDTYRWAQSLECVDPDNIAIMGYCLGGLCALDLARADMPIKAAVSIHGVFTPPELPCSVTARVLVLHGYDDPQVPPSGLSDFADEMNGYGADWQVHFYSQTKHAFTDPNAADIGPPEFGREFNERSRDRAWKSSLALFAEVF